VFNVERALHVEQQVLACMVIAGKPTVAQKKHIRYVVEAGIITLLFCVDKEVIVVDPTFIACFKRVLHFTESDITRAAERAAFTIVYDPEQLYGPSEKCLVKDKDHDVSRPLFLHELLNIVGVHDV